MHPSYEWSLSTIITTLLMKVNYLCVHRIVCTLRVPSCCDLRHWKISVITRYNNYSDILVLGFQTYSFGKMNAQKCKLICMIIQTNLAIDLAISFGIMDQVHYIDNRFNLKLQPISLHVVNNFMSCLISIFTTLKNQFHELCKFISQRTIHHV